MLVSVIIPAYNAENYIARAIESVLKQSYKNYEIIVIDDGSIDNTSKKIKKNDNSVHYFYQKNGGPSKARNRGIKEAKGKWIAFLDADDEWLPKKLELQMEMVHKHPELKWCGTNYYRIVSKRKHIRGRIDGSEKESIENYFQSIVHGRLHMCTSTLITHKSVFKIIGKFDLNFLRHQDRDIFWRIAYVFPKIGYIKIPLAYHHLDTTDHGNDKLRLEATTRKLWLRLTDKHANLSKKLGREKEFKLVGGFYLKKTILYLFFFGHVETAKSTVIKFGYLLPRYWKWIIWLGIWQPFPAVFFIRFIDRLLLIINLKRQSGRRWLLLKQLKV